MSVDWNATATPDPAIGSSIASPGNDRTNEYSNDPNKIHEVSVQVTYGGVYDGPVIAYVLRKYADTANYDNQDNADLSFPINGALSSAGRRTFTVGPDINAFLVELQNDSGATVTGVEVTFRDGTLPT